MLQIKNPVLPGFNADPSIIRVDDTYYIANSTFEWFPGVRLHESKDLGIWRGNPRPFNDRDESAACFYHAINLPKA